MCFQRIVDFSGAMPIGTEDLPNRTNRKGEAMKRFLWLIIVPFLLLNFATAVNISNVDMAFGVLDGGENLSYRFLFISGTTFFASLGGLADDCYGSDVCGGDFFSPGTSLVPRVTIGDFENPGGVVRVNGH